MSARTEDAKLLETLRKEARFDLPESALSSRERAARAQYRAIAEKLESPDPRSY